MVLRADEQNVKQYVWPTAESLSSDLLDISKEIFGELPVETWTWLFLVLLLLLGVQLRFRTLVNVEMPVDP